MEQETPKMAIPFQRQISVPTTVDLSLEVLKERPDRSLQSCFSFFKTHPITARELCNLALGSSCLSLSELDYINKLKDCDMQKEYILKFVLKKGKSSCYKFIKQLHFHNYSSILEVLARSPAAEIDFDLGENNILTSQFLQKQLKFLSTNIKVYRLLDMLLERGVLTIDEHDQVQRHKRRSNKRKELLSILFKKSNETWLPCFVKCLKLTGHDGLLTELRSRKRGHRGGTQVWAELPSQYVAHIENVEDQHIPQDLRPACSNENIMEIISESIEAGVLDYWEGSLYLLLYTNNPLKMNAILMEKSLVNVRCLLNDIFNDNPRLIKKCETDKVLKIDLEERRSHEFLGENQGRKNIMDRKYMTDECLHCFHETVQGNYAEILDEIEDDIINDVISKCPDISSHARHLCQDATKTRIETAAVFLQLALANDFVLDSLRDSLKMNSSVDFIPFKCQVCKSRKLHTGTSVDNDKVSFYFKLHRLEKGSIQVEMMEDYTDKEAALFPRRLSRSRSIHHMSLEKIPDLSKKKRIVFIHGKGKDCHQDFGRIWRNFTTYDMEFSSESDLDDIVVAKCIAYMSPGPHAFVALCRLNEVVSLNAKVSELVKVFGRNVLSYIIIICFYDGKQTSATNADIMVRNLSLFKNLENGCLLVDTTRVQEEQLQVTFNKHLANLQNETSCDYFTNECFEKSERRITEEKKSIEGITKYRIYSYQEKIKYLEQKNSREEATKEVAERLILKCNKNRKGALEQC